MSDVRQIISSARHTINTLKINKIISETEKCFEENRQSEVLVDPSVVVAASGLLSACGQSRPQEMQLT